MRSRLRTILCCVVLEFGVLSGVPMRPEQIHDLMRNMNAPKIARAIPDESESGDSLPPR